MEKVNSKILLTETKLESTEEEFDDLFVPPLRRKSMVPKSTISKLSKSHKVTFRDEVKIMIPKAEDTE